MPGNLKNYLREGIDYCVFITGDDKDVKYEVDEFALMSDITNWDTVWNMIGRAKCYTHPDFITDSGRGTNVRQQR